MSSQHVKDAPDLSEPIIEDVVELCDFCVKLTEKISENLSHNFQTVTVSWDFRSKITPGMCRFCEIISNDQFTRDVSVTTQYISDWEMGRRWTSKEPRYNRICATHIERCMFAMWADPGSAASTSLNDRAPILCSQMDQAGDLIQHWRRACSTHERCTPEDDTVMPTRILALDGEQAQPSIHLVKSEDQRGRYIALSHCWGSTEKRPPQTTSDNLKAQQAGIAFEGLPKTFQDVVELAQVIGIRYVWIDSLCIIQDDLQDWLSEAERMRDVYRNAAVVVAASGARDCSEGLFISDRSRAKVFRLPYRINGKVQGKFNMMQLSGAWDPKSGPLESRAWTLQERYLAQRFLAFMPHRVTWICQTTSRDEVGCRYNIRVRANHIWLSLLQEYTRRSLTVPSDRTKALRGIAAELQRSRKDRYIAEYGVWEEQLVDQLLWRADSQCFEDLPTVPSWSWVATRGTKVWPDDDASEKYESVQESQEMPKHLVITTTGRLQVSGHLSTKQLARSRMQDACTMSDLEIDELEEFQYPYARYYPERCRNFRVITQDRHEACYRTVLGIARFDNISTTSCTHMCFLAKSKRKKAEDIHNGYPDKENHPATLEPRSMREQTIGNVIYYIEQHPDFVYWALLLELASDGVFRRVGMATLLPAAYEAFQVQVQDFEII